MSVPASSAVADRRHRLSGALVTAVAVSLPLAVAALWTKHHVLTDGAWGTHPRLPDALLEAVPLFLSDIFQALVVTPLLLVALFGWLSGRKRVIAMGGATLVLTAAVAAGWLTFLGVGGWPTIGLTSEFVRAIGTDAGLINPAAYLPPGTLRAAAWLVALAAVPLILASHRVGRILEDRAVSRAVALIFIGAVAAGATRATIGDSNGAGHGVMFRLLSGLTQARSMDVGTRAGAAEASFTDWPSISFSDPATGRLPGLAPPNAERACRSAILVVLETAPERDYSWATMRAAMPRNRWHLDRAVVAHRHMASHLRSNRADFTMLSGVYDLTDDRPLQTYLRRAGAQPSGAPGIAAMLRKAGYDTRYYFPSRFTFEDDNWAVDYLGFEHVFQSTHRFARVLDQELRVANERQIFDRAVADLRAMDPAKPFFIVLRTIVGHDPTFSPRTGESVTPEDSTGRGEVIRDVLTLVDSLLRNVIVAASERTDSSRIAVAVVADHGIRNFRDPDLGQRPFPLVGYRVPAVISCPSLFDKTVFTTGVTSHVDIHPTLAWVLGFDPTTSETQGLVMTDPRLPHRFTFLFAAKAGMDAVIQGDTITAVSTGETPSYRVHMSNSPVATTLFDRGSPATADAEARFAALRRAQYDMIERLSRKGQSLPP